MPNRKTLKGKRDYAILLTLATSGISASEMTSLSMPQIIAKDGGYILMVCGKNDEEPREAPLAPRAYKAILDWMNARSVESEYIFIGNGGRGETRFSSKLISKPSLWQLVVDYAKEAGFDHVKTHDFRRFVGTELAKTDIRKALGRKRIDTTAKHYDLNELEVGLTDNLLQEEV